MKYFIKELLNAKHNEPITKGQWHADRRKFQRTCNAYQKQLRKLKGRVSRQARNFFYFGFARWGLHDAHLLSFAIGDGLNHRADGRLPFKYNREKAKVRISILDRHQCLLYTFDCSAIRSVNFDYPKQDPRWDWGRIDHILTYELNAVNKRYLSLEFQVDSDATIFVEFARLKFKRQRIRRRYPPEAAYL